MKKNVLMAGVAAIVGFPAFTWLPAQEQIQPAQAIKLKMAEQKGGGRSGIVKLVKGSTVTGAPYSADAVTETSQILGDGNRIAQSSSMKLYRDGQGRERQEEGGVEATRIFISDPVAKASFTLNPQAHTVLRSAAPAGLWILKANTEAGLADARNNQLQALEVMVKDLEAARAGTSARLGAVYRVDGAVTPGSPEPATEQLSPRTIEGVFATGTRTTVTIPAGQIGNQQPIQVVDEVWYSPDLQMNVMTRHSDPRTGEVVYQLKNIRRGEPDSSLFQVPPDYKTAEGGGGRGSVAP